MGNKMLIATYWLEPNKNNVFRAAYLPSHVRDFMQVLHLSREILATTLCVVYPIISNAADCIK